MYKTIMVPTDCSGFDREAIRVALRLAERSDATVRLVRVLSTGAFFGMGSVNDGVAVAVEALGNARETALTELYALASECRANTSANVIIELEQGPVPDTLAGHANRHDVDLIVISSHGRVGFSRLSLGSVTDSLIRHTTIPVLVVKPSASYLNPQVGEPFRRIVVPLDGSPLAEQILPRVATLAKLEGSELILLFVLKPHDELQNRTQDPRLPWWEADVAATQTYLFRTAAKLRRHGFPVSTDIVIGQNVPEEIAAFASREKADLIGIATHGRGGLSRMLRGSVSDALTRAARVSTLVFHPEMSAIEPEAVGQSRGVRQAAPTFG
jgi:nucleotide-binding universal stress UspA family protein